MAKSFENLKNKMAPERRKRVEDEARRRLREIQQLREMADEEIDCLDIPEVDDDFWESAEIIESKG